MTVKKSSVTTWSRCGIEKDLVAVKLLYFFSMSAVGTVFPFVPLLLTHLGLTPPELGLIFSVVPLLAFFKNLLVGFVADKWLCHRYLLVASCIASSIVNMLFLAVPVQPAAATAHRSALLACHSNDSDTLWLACGPPCTTYHGDPAGQQRCAYLCTNDYFHTDIGTDHAVQLTQSVPADGSPLMLANISRSDSSVIDILMHCQPAHHDVNRVLSEACHSGNGNVTVACRRPQPFDIVAVQSKSVSYTGTPTFFMSFLLIALSSFCMSNQMLLTDAIVYNILGPDRRHQWGYSRLWGSVGYGLSCLLGSALMQSLIDAGSPQRYEPALFTSGALGLVAAVLACLTRAADETAVRCGQTLRHVRQALSGARVRLFFAMLLPASVLNSIWQTYALLSLELRFGAPKLVVGASVLAVTAVEVPMFFVGGRLVKAIGAVPCIYLSLVAFAVRFSGLAYIPDGWLVLPLDVLHCLSFTLFYTAASVHSSSVASPSTMAVMQGLVNGTVFGIGLAMGAFVGGHVLSLCSFRVLFVGCAVGAGLALVLIAFLHEVIMRQCCPPLQPQPDQVTKTENKDVCADEATVAMLDNKASMPA